MSGIILHPQYGVNPTIPVCFFCGKSRNEVVLLGNKYKHEAPMHMCLDYEPCDACKTQMAQGITFAVGEEVQQTRKGPKVPGNGYRLLGGWMVIKEEAVRRLIADPALLEHILHDRFVVVERAVFDMLLPPQVGELTVDNT